MRKLILLVLLSLLSGPAIGQEQSVPLSGKNAINILSQKFGATNFQWIVEMRAFKGVPQPREWTTVVYDPGSLSLLTEYWVGEGRAVNEGPYDDIYPDKAPIGYIDFAKLKLDSTAAFTVAEGEARRSKIGFDSLNYVLRSREYSTEPVWILALIDADQKLVGKVHVSGLTGSVLRTIWINRQGTTPIVIDSAVPSANSPTGAPAGTTRQPPRGNGQLYPSTKPTQGSARVPERRIRSTDQ